MVMVMVRLVIEEVRRKEEAEIMEGGGRRGSEIPIRFGCRSVSHPGRFGIGPENLVGSAGQPTDAHPTLDLVSIVEDLHGLASKEISKLLKDSESSTIQCYTGRGSLRQVDMERLAASLPLHLIAVLLSSDNGMRFAQLLRGVRLLHILADLATRHTKLEQILLDDVKVSEHFIDLVFFMLIVLAQTDQEYGLGTSVPPVHSALVACTLHLLTGFISPQWHELVFVLLAHPKVDTFMDVAFDAVHASIRLLHVKLSVLDNDILCKSSSLPAAERIANYLCQQCEASLQFLLSLCQQKLFRDRILKNKELCKNGSILSLCHTILKLKVPDSLLASLGFVAAISRLKSKVLSILLQLCEAESFSYLDEVAVYPKSMHLAKSVVLEILDLLKAAFKKEVKHIGNSLDRSNPKGLVLLNSLRIADIYSDDSNFRSFFMTNAIEVLIEILATAHEEFLSSWCCSDMPAVEEDSILEYDPFTAAGVALIFPMPDCENALLTSSAFNENNFGCHHNFNGTMPSVTYAQQRTSYLVKVIANLHVFVPNICEEEERNLFLNKFHECLCTEAPESSGYPLNFKDQKPATVCENLSSLSEHATSLNPNLLNDDDVNLLRLFTDQLKKKIFPQVGDDLIQDTQNTCGGAPLTLERLDGSSLGETVNFKAESEQQIVTSKPEDLVEDVELNHYKRKNIAAAEPFKGIEKENQSIKDDVDMISGSREPSKAGENAKESIFQDDEKAENIQGEEKQPRKRKRNIMSEKQINLIEKALLDEPEMQRNSVALQSWADKLSAQGPEITASQLKNWLNNRKARLARAAREVRAPSEGENVSADKTSGNNASHFYESPDSASEEQYIPPSKSGASKASRSSVAEDHKPIPPSDTTMDSSPSQQVGPVLNQYSRVVTHLKPGQAVVVVDREGKEVGRGKVFQVEGRWAGKNLEEVGVCIVDINEIKVDRSKEVQYPSEGGGRTFEEAVARNGGVARVAWDVVRVHQLPH